MEFVVYPAIDIRLGKCVRLRQGVMDDFQVYGDDPLEMARQFAEAGAKALHVVDLDGAFAGEGKNLEAAGRIASGVAIPVQLGGGIRTMRDIQARLDMGISRVILGTAALKDPALVKAAARAHPGRIVVGIDARDGRVAVEGWVKATETTPVELALRMRDAGIDTLVFTDIALDGMLGGPNIASTRELIEKTGMRVIGSGGVACADDIAALREIGAAGAITGKAIYDGRINLQEVLQLYQQ